MEGQVIKGTARQQPEKVSSPGGASLLIRRAEGIKNHDTGSSLGGEILTPHQEHHERHRDKEQQRLRWGER